MNETIQETTNRVKVWYRDVERRGYDPLHMVSEYARCRRVSVDAGYIWISDPVSGHWMSQDEVSEFLSWAQGQPLPYCVQNDSQCETCALVNYGLDCRNHPVRDWSEKVPE